MRFIGLTYRQCNSILSEFGRKGVQRMTEFWMTRNRPAQDRSISLRTPTTSQSHTQTPCRQPGRKRRIDAITSGTTVSLSRRYGCKDWWATCGQPFFTIWQQRQRWTHLFWYNRPPCDGVCWVCGHAQGYERLGERLCAECRWKQWHTEGTCRGLHCFFCKCRTTTSWWALAVGEPVCDTCKELSRTCPTDGGADCPVPGCLSRRQKIIRSIDGVKYCKTHSRGAPNARFATMIRLQRCLHLLLSSNDRMDNSYHRQTIETLWPLGETKQQGGLTELNDPTSGWLLSEVLQHFKCYISVGDIGWGGCRTLAQHATQRADTDEEPLGSSSRAMV
jgi:hypothetical protein